MLFKFLFCEIFWRNKTSFWQVIILLILKLVNNLVFQTDLRFKDFDASAFNFLDFFGFYFHFVNLSFSFLFEIYLCAQYLQLPNLRWHSCESCGKLRRFMMHEASRVTLFEVKNTNNVKINNNDTTCSHLWAMLAWWIYL